LQLAYATVEFDEYERKISERRFRLLSIKFITDKISGIWR
jgi:hypothetical protein